MLADDRTHMRLLAVQRILKAREVRRSTANPAIPMNNIRISNLPTFDLNATNYFNVINIDVI